MPRASAFLLTLALLLPGCSPALFQPTLTPAPTVIPPAMSVTPVLAPTITPTGTVPPSPTPSARVPDFAHIVMIVFENKEFGLVIGKSTAPTFNRYARDYTVLSQHYAIRHPSLPNYLALIGGDTFGIESDCTDCFINASTLPDQIESSGRTWKTYQEDMPRPCFVGDTLNYNQKHNPFIYFDLIRLDPVRCERSIVPLPDLDLDIAANALPNFFFIMPNLCNSAHDCPLSTADSWLNGMMDKLVPALDGAGQPYLIIITWDEGNGDHGCCGLGEAGGRIATVLVSPQVRNGFDDGTPYTHYSILKTIEQSWGLAYLGHAADEQNLLIITPWK